MKVKFIGDIPIRLNDKPVQPGEVIDVDLALASALIDGGRFESAEPKPKRKKKKDATQNEEG